MKREVPIFTDYNMIKKLMVMPIFIFFCGFPVFLIIDTESKNIGSICFFLFLGIISLSQIIIIYTNHISVYKDRIETGNVFSKKTTLFESIKKLDIRLVQESYRGGKYIVSYAIFFGEHGQELLKLRIESTLSSKNRIADIISVMENYNNKIELGKDVIKYLNENINYKKNNKL